MRRLSATLRLAFLLLGTFALFPLALGSPLLRFLGREAAAIRWSARVQSWWCALELFGLGVRFDLPAQPPPGPGPFLVAANHLSYVDIFVLGRLFPGRFVAKSEIAAWPLVGFLSNLIGTIFVVQSRRRDLLRVGGHMDRTLDAGVNVLLFPEGGASRGLGIEKLHPALFQSAVKAGTPCLAVALSYETPADPWAPAATVCWWGGMNLPRHLWRLLGLRGVTARVRWSPAPLSGRDRKELARALGQELTSAFEPVRQEPLAPDEPWAELFREPA